MIFGKISGVSGYFATKTSVASLSEHFLRTLLLLERVPRGFFPSGGFPHASDSLLAPNWASFMLVECVASPTAFMY